MYYNEIHSLTLSNEQIPDQVKDFLQKYSFKDFKYLKFLRLIKPSSNEFNIIINDLCNVETLDMATSHLRAKLQSATFFHSLEFNANKQKVLKRLL